MLPAKYDCIQAQSDNLQSIRIDNSDCSLFDSCPCLQFRIRHYIRYPDGLDYLSDSIFDCLRCN